ncbi:MAG: hypothetical protein HY304_04400 [candidate division Zixibacteria bacterium]|nr:hypothetical protein [candidate division Zixibacteria bacterium]
MANPLPITYGVPWVAADLDLDGNIELVVQRGDVGFGGNGYLDILSAPTWTLRRRFTFPDMKVYMFAVAVNVDADPDLELFLTPGDLGQSHAVLIDYDRDSANFVIVSDVPMPELTTGQAAIGDFDNDGRVEFIVGGDYGYKLFECDGRALNYIGRLGDTTALNNTHAIAARAKPVDTLYALLGHSTDDSMGMYYELMKPTGDNTFENVHTFWEPPYGVGVDPCFASDVDCDGLDELIMQFYPTVEKWEWDAPADSFVRGCSWDEDSLGTFLWFHAVDLNQDGVAEWGVVNHLNVFLDIPDSCTGCTNTGRCPFPGPSCNCPCGGDPHCDGQVNILDVVETIGVAFRGTSPTYDSMCPRDRTDVDCSGVTDILDVVRTVNVAFRAGDAATEFCNPCTK